MTDILRNPPADSMGRNIYRGLPGEEAALARGIAMLKLGRDGKALSFQNDEIDALLRKLEN